MENNGVKGMNRGRINPHNKLFGIGGENS